MTAISWTDETWNPVTGCTMVSPGCALCYAQTVDYRFDHDKVGKLPWAFPASQGGRGVTLHPDRLDKPLHWKKPRRIFVDSMSDLFHEDVPFEFIAKVWDTMFNTSVLANTPHHTYQILTKRPDLMLEFSKWMNDTQHRRIDYSNVWLGVSVENQLWADRRIPLLLQTPAAVRFISAEPLLAPVDIDPFLECPHWNDSVYGAEGGDICCQLCGKPRACQPLGLDWIIAGCESGPKHRPMDTDWARSLRDQCQAAGVPFFLKQMYVDGKKVETPELDGKAWAEMPEVRSA